MTSLKILFLTNLDETDRVCNYYIQIKVDQFKCAVNPKTCLMLLINNFAIMSSRFSNVQVCAYYNIYSDAYEPLQKVFRGKSTAKQFKTRL
jgi:hypothetical protein